jgi:CBS domain-containing protein
MSRSLKFLSCESAAAPTEYAVVIALVAASLMLAGQSVQYAANSTFSQTAVALGGSQPAAAPSMAPSGANVVAVGGPVANSAAVVPFLHGIAWAVLFLAAALVFYSRYRLRRARRQLEELHCGPEPIADDPTNPNFQKRQDIQRVLLKISDRDIKGRRGWLARHVMTASPLTVTPVTPVNQAISMMLHRRISCLPVVENGQVKGILTVTDMLMTLQCLMKLLERSTTADEPVPSGSPLADFNAELPSHTPAAAC